MKQTLNTHREKITLAELEEAIQHANIPTLLSTLIHLTNDSIWMSERYRIGRPLGMSDNDSGGLSKERSSEIRAASLKVFWDWLNDKAPPNRDMSPNELIKILSFTFGEKIPQEYGPMFNEDLQYSGIACSTCVHPNDLTNTLAKSLKEIPNGFRACIIGAGISGITAAMAFEASGIDYVILEQYSSAGGCWYENKYPGAGVDTPTHLYCWPNIGKEWNRFFSLRDDVLEYIRNVADSQLPSERIRFEAKVISAKFEEIKGLWEVGYEQSGHSIKENFNILISAVGLFNTPNEPGIPGHELFQGTAVHTARWQDKLNLTGKRVAVIGSGASAMQVVPAIADKVRSLAVFQRTPQWVAPFEKFQMEVPPSVRKLISIIPLYGWWYRARLMWVFNDRAWPALEKDPLWEHPDRSINKTNEKVRILFTDYIREQLNGREDLIAKTIPSYPPFVKRILFDNGWYKALLRDNVDLVTENVSKITKDSVITADGKTYQVDVILYATGFNAVRFLSTFELVGLNGLNIRKLWGDDNAKAYLGTVVPGFPNFFCLYGPNLQAGHGGSFMTTATAQVNYIMSLLEQMFCQGIRVIDCKKEVCQDYNSRVDEANASRIWTHKGANNYYRNAQGRVVVNRAFKNLDYWNWTRSAKLSEYHVLSGLPTKL